MGQTTLREFARAREQTTDDSDALLSTVGLSAFGLVREPPRALDDRLPGYESLFDYDTLFYDVFRTGDGTSVICLGPPLLNCEPVFSDATFRIPGAESPVPYAYQPAIALPAELPIPSLGPGYGQGDIPDSECGQQESGDTRS